MPFLFVFRIALASFLIGFSCLVVAEPISAPSRTETFQISPEFQEKYGYPNLTREIKTKIFGLNAAKPYGTDPAYMTNLAAKDRLSIAKKAYLEAPNPHYKTYGPKTRREFLTLLRNQNNNWAG